MLRNGQGADCGLDRVGKPGDLRGLGIRRHTSPANHRIPQSLDVPQGKKTRKLVDSSSERGPSARWRKGGNIPSPRRGNFQPIHTQRALGRLFDAVGACSRQRSMVAGDAEGVGVGDPGQADGFAVGKYLAWRGKC